MAAFNSAACRCRFGFQLRSRFLANAGDERFTVNDEQLLEQCRIVRQRGGIERERGVRAHRHNIRAMDTKGSASTQKKKTFCRVSSTGAPRDDLQAGQQPQQLRAIDGDGFVLGGGKRNTPRSSRL